MNTFLDIVISNVFIAAGLFALLMLLQRRIKNPALLHLFLLLILVKLITPAYWQPKLELLPSIAEKKSALVGDEIQFQSPLKTLFSRQQPLDNQQTVTDQSQPISQNGLRSLDPAALSAGTLSEAEQTITKIENRKAEFGRTWFIRLSMDSEYRTFVITRLVLAVWFTGTIVCFLLAAWRIIRFQWFLSRAQPAPENLIQMTAALAAKIGLKRVPKIEMVAGNISPLLWACFSRARIILPVGLLDQLEEAELETLLLHELAHYRRGDHWVRIVELLATSVYWWNPVVWLVRHQIRIAEEQCCDAWVVQTLPEKRRSYAEVLVKAIGYISRPTYVTGATRIGSADILEQRIKHIMCDSLTSNISRRAKSGVAVIAVLLLPFAPILGQPLSRTIAAEEKEALPTPQDILAGYRANFQKLMPVEINYQLLTSESLACINQDRRSLKDAKFKLTLDRTDIKVDGKVYYDEEMFQMFIAGEMDQVEFLKKQLKPENIKKRLTERITKRGYFWSDGTSFHRRWPKKQTDKEVKLNAGRVAPPWKLKSHYRSMNLTSWSRNNSPPLRCWFGGGDHPDSGQGIVGNDYDSASLLKTIAPLGQVKLDWNEPFDIHNLDAFMAKAPSHYQVVGQSELHGRPMILMDGYFTPPQKTGVRKRIRAWVDSNQGYLPLRMEWDYVDVDGKPGKYIHRHIEVLKVQQVADAFYPIRIKLQEYVYDAIVAEQQLQEMKEGKSTEDLSPTPMIPGRTLTWEVTEFTPNKRIEPEVLALKFPQGMPYRNDIDDRQYITGKSKPLPLPPKSLQVGEIAPPLQVARWFDGKSRSLSDFQGKVVVLFFMDISGFSKVPNDMQQHLDGMMKYMREIYEKYDTKGAVFLEIHPAGTTPEQIRAYQKFRQFESVAAIDSGTNKASGLTANQYNGINPDVAFFLIGRDGRIAFNEDALESESGKNLYVAAARKLSIPLNFDENIPEEVIMRRAWQIIDLIIREQIDKALSAKQTQRNITGPK